MAYIPKYLNFQQERKIGEHTIYLPDPPNIRNIANRDKLEHKQKFQITELPKGFEQWDTQSKNDFKSAEWDKRMNGYWFFNNGNLEYITGAHYFYINWWTLDEGKPRFIDADRDFFLLWDYVEKNPKCIGLYYVTGRRTGKSYKSVCLMYEKISRMRDSQGAMQTINKEIGDELFAKLLTGWRNLPDFFRPLDKGSSNPKDKLEFFEPNKRSTKNKDKEYEKALNSLIFIAPSGEVALESRKFKMIIHDEIAKTERVDIYKRFSVASICCVQGQNKIVGKLLATTTVEELKNTDNWDKSKKLWDDSELSKENKKTKFDSQRISQTRMIRYFQPANYGNIDTEINIDGESINGVDEYGYSRRDLVKEYIIEERSFMNSFNLKEHRMKYPLDESDAWQGATSSFYESSLLEEAKMVAEDEQEHTIRRVTFYETKEGLIDIKDDENGFWWICWDFKNKSESNRVEYDYRSGTIKPLNNMKFSMGYDPAGNDGDIKGGSTPAALVKMEYDDKYEDFFNTYICLYYGRRRTWKEMDRDIEYMCRYYGCKVQIEKDQPLANNRMTENIRTRGFVANAGINSVDLSKSRGAITKEAISKMKEFGVRSGSAYALAQAKSLSQEYVIENYTKLKIPMMIDDLLKYDDTKRTNYDICCAFQWCEFESDNKYKLAKKTNKTNTPIKSHVYAPIISTKKYF